MGVGTVDDPVGYDIHTPDDVNGPSLDFNVEVAAAAGGDIAFSFDPTYAPSRFSGFVIGISAVAPGRIGACVQRGRSVSQGKAIRLHFA